MELIVKFLSQTSNVFFVGLSLTNPSVGIASGDTRNVLREDRVEESFPDLEVTHGKGRDCATVPRPLPSDEMVSGFLRRGLFEEVLTREFHRSLHSLGTYEKEYRSEYISKHERSIEAT